MKIYYTSKAPTTTAAAALLRAALLAFAGLSSLVVQQVYGRPIDFDLPQQAADAAAAVPGSVPDAVLEKWKADAGVKAEVDLAGRLQTVSDRNTVVVPGNGLVDLDDLVPVEMLTPDASCFAGGLEIDCATVKPTVFTGTKTTGNGNQAQVLVSYDGNGNLLYIKVTGEQPGNSGKTVDYLQSIGTTNVLTYIEDGDYDPEWLAQWSFDDILDADDEGGPSIRRSLQTYGDADRYQGSLRRSIKQQIENKILQEQEGGNRRLATPDKRRVKLAVESDSSFCSFVGGTHEDARAKINSIVADVMGRYAVPNLNFHIQLSHVATFCGGSNDSGSEADPYPSFLGGNATRTCAQVVDGDSGLRNFWNANRPNPNLWDLFQFFTGTSFVPPTIGCAYVGVTCKTPTSAYGANNIAFSGNTQLQGVLVAHEMGHNIGANHLANSAYIMNDELDINGSGDQIFSQASIDSFLVDRNVDMGNLGCFEEIPATESPSVSASPSISASSSVEPSVSASPSKSPSDSPSDGPSASPSLRPSSSPSTSPSDGPSDSPSAAPIGMPSGSPSAGPSSAPSVAPSDKPSVSPSAGPSDRPSTAPSDIPSASPSAKPSPAPSESPSSSPISPTTEPSDSPSGQPSSQPSEAPVPAFQCSSLTSLGGGACKRDSRCQWSKGDCIEIGI